MTMPRNGNDKEAQGGGLHKTTEDTLCGPVVHGYMWVEEPGDERDVDRNNSLLFFWSPVGSHLVSNALVFFKCLLQMTLLYMSEINPVEWSMQWFKKDYHNDSVSKILKEKQHEDNYMISKIVNR